KPKKGEAHQEFHAYGTPDDGAQDPRQIAIDKLMKEVSALKKRVNELEEQEEDIEKTADKWKVHGE
ncbi:MAG: hypothetical protein KDD76_04895, partial [Rickettsiales bacterium]|nr:hypothetical protein [Rickettsiales bacterium]